MVLQQVSKIGNIIAPSTLASVVYHNLFDFPLTSGELIRWEVQPKLLKPFHLPKDLCYLKGLYFLNGQEGLLTKRALRKRISQKKLDIACRAASFLKRLKAVRGVFVTGSVAMENADLGSDVDLMIITESGKMWTTRFLSYLLLILTGFRIRRYGIKDEKDKLCLNMWMDESNLSWPEGGRNLFSAHEIIQIKPLVNKGGVYESLLYENRWVKYFWPSAISIKDQKVHRKQEKAGKLEKYMYLLQRKYMKGKITNETIGTRRAIFHPINLWPGIAKRLKTSGFKI